MTMLRRATLVVLVLLAAGSARAETLDWTMQLTLEHASVALANAENRRKVGIMDISGPAEIDGEAAQVRVLVLFDYTNGSGPWQTYMMVEFAGGAGLTAHGSGMTLADADGLNSRFDGALEVVDGTGRYAGAQGSGRMTGQRAEAVGDDVAIDYEITLELMP